VAITLFSSNAATPKKMGKWGSADKEAVQAGVGALKTVSSTNFQVSGLWCPEVCPDMPGIHVSATLYVNALPPFVSVGFLNLGGRSCHAMQAGLDQAVTNMRSYTDCFGGDPSTTENRIIVLTGALKTCAAAKHPLIVAPFAVLMLPCPTTLAAPVLADWLVLCSCVLLALRCLPFEAGRTQSHPSPRPVCTSVRRPAQRRRHYG
jgi:hypothetical protein